MSFLRGAPRPLSPLLRSETRLMFPRRCANTAPVNTVEEPPVEPDQPTTKPVPDTTALYLAKRMCAERGYSPGTVPEAAAFAEASDIVLTKADGMSFQVICIIDREADPGRTFGLTRDTVTETGKACLKYTGTVNSAKMPVGVQVWEVGRDVGSKPDLQRLKNLSRSMPGLAKVVISGWAIDTANGRVATTARFNGFFAGRRYLERVLHEPRRGDHELVRPAAPAVSAGVGQPWVTYSLLALLAVMFVGELMFAVRPWKGLLGADIMTLVATGGLSRPLVQEGEWYRLFTSAFLHADLFHLALNGIALFFAGVVLENLVGRAWLLAIFTIGALGGSALSYALNPPNIVSIGASGAIMALLAAAFVGSFRIPSGAQRTQLQVPLMQILIPSLIPLATHRMAGEIDFAGHLGGAVTGVLAGVFLMRTWVRTEPLPRFRTGARVVAAAGLVLVVAGFAFVKKNYDQYAEAAAAGSFAALLIPDEQLSKGGDDELATQGEDLVARYPRDPRARLFNALRLVKSGDTPAAQAELRRGLEERDILKSNFPDRRLETAMRGFLAQLLLSEGKKDEAEDAAAPVCRAGPDGAVPDSLRELSVCK